MFRRLATGRPFPKKVEACPTGALQFGTRRELIEEARRQINTEPQKYYHHIYGEHEVGGTSWLYLSAVPFQQIGFRTALGQTAYPTYTKGYLTNITVVDMVVLSLLLGLSYHAAARNDRENDKYRDIMNGNSKRLETFILGELKPQGLGYVTSLSQEFLWGLWIGFAVLIGITFAGGAYVFCFIYYIIGYKQYHPFIRVTALNGFLAYTSGFPLLL